MTEQDIKNKNLVLISYLDSIIDGYKVKAEFSTNKGDTKAIVCQETSGNKVVFYNNDNPLFNYFTINVYGNSIQEPYETANIIGNLIGKHILVNYKGQKWQLIFKQMANPRAIQYLDIRRAGYTTTLQCVVNRVA